MLVISYKLTSFPRSVRQEGLFSLVAKSAGYNSKKKKKTLLVRMTQQRTRKRGEYEVIRAP